MGLKPAMKIRGSLQFHARVCEPDGRMGNEKIPCKQMAGEDDRGQIAFVEGQPPRSRIEGQVWKPCIRPLCGIDSDPPSFRMGR